MNRIIEWLWEGGAVDVTIATLLAVIAMREIISTLYALVTL